MHVLHIESSPRGAHSHSRQVADTLVASLKDSKNASVVFRDLNSPPLPHVSEAWVNASLYNRATGAPLSPEEEATLRLSDELVAEVKAADVLVFGVPMYNFGVPSAAKAWFDHIARFGSTFTYGAKGPEGLLGGRKLIAVSARGGGGYGEGEARNGENHVDRHIHTFFALLGITDVTVIPIENTARGEEVTRQSIAEAHAKIEEIVAGL